MSWAEKAIEKVGKFFSLRASFEEWKVAINDLNTTNFLIFTGVAMGTVTGIMYFVTWVIKMILAVKYGGVADWEMPTIIHWDVFALWLAFVAGWMGFSVRQFNIKRETHFEAGQESIRHARARNGERK